MLICQTRNKLFCKNSLNAKMNLCSVLCGIFLLVNLVNLTVFGNENVNINLNLAENNSISSPIISQSNQTSNSQSKSSNSVLNLTSSSVSTFQTNSQMSSQNNSNFTLILTPNNSLINLPTNPSSNNSQPNIITNSTNFVTNTITNTIRTGGFGGVFLFLAILILCFSPIFLIQRFRNPKIQIVNNKTNSKITENYYKDLEKRNMGN